MSELFGSLEWVRPKAWKMDWELRKGEKVVATMSSPKMFGTSVTATFGEDHYSLRKGGLRKPGAVIRKLGAEDNIAVMEFDALGKGTLSAAGHSYQWERVEEGNWYLSQEGRGTIFALARDTLSKNPTGKVDVDIGDPQLGPLLLLVWFVVSTSEC